MTDRYRAYGSSRPGRDGATYGKASETEVKSETTIRRARGCCNGEPPDLSGYVHYCSRRASHHLCIVLNVSTRSGLPHVGLSPSPIFVKGKPPSSVAQKRGHRSAALWGGTGG